MEIEDLEQELTKRINSLKTELDISIRQKEVLSVIGSLKSINNSRRGYNGIEPAINISRESFNDFISLLSPDEYLKGYSSGGRNFFDGHSEKYIFDKYYLSLGPGVVLELSFCETEINGYSNSIKESELFISSFTDSQDLFIKVDSETYGFPVIEILDQNGKSVFQSNTTDEYLKFANQGLNEALRPILVEDLTSRFLNPLQIEEKKGPIK